MTREEFQRLLHDATHHAVEFARQYVHNKLPQQFRYHVLLNQSCDLNARPDTKLYPEDDGREFACITEDEVVELLLRDGRCPEWIDIKVEGQSFIDTRLELTCCGRFTNDPSRLYYATRGPDSNLVKSPFGVKSPWLPPGHRDGQRFWVPFRES